ncbi:DEAD/DEAH box helicase [Hymenobacter jeollabukensis]|uniref:DEAD/DEAH box helicase n=1 Tax=Hymenobacter jeollabukensis TaxID=2025313 RepID=A0A5R8WKP6_9BACT|nr:DEAD/DEAH box helicase [Hymenobacter jeollabukensis]TLM89404.1 DEAD/DEAH box helicase [Hymenobacter jeollabukensis]
MLFPDDALLTPDSPPPHRYQLPGLAVSTLTSTVVELHAAAPLPAEARPRAIQPEALTLDAGTFSRVVEGLGATPFPPVTVTQTAAGLDLSCACGQPLPGLCAHQAEVLLAVLQRKELRLFFDAPARHTYLRPLARDYGLDQAVDLDAHFELRYDPKAGLTITPRQAALYPVTPAAKQELMAQLLPAAPPTPTGPAGAARLVVLGRHRYYGHLQLHLAEAALTATGKLKNPVALLNPLDEVWGLADPALVKFYSGLARLQQNYDDARSLATLEALRAVVLNPAALPVFAHDAEVAEKPNAASLRPVELRRVPPEVRLEVRQRDEFYEISGQLLLHDQPFDLRELSVAFEYFVAAHGAYYLLDDLHVWRVVEFFQRRNNTLLIHQSRFVEFRQDVLAGLEARLHISYHHARPATPVQAQTSGLDAPPEALLYLTERGAHVELLPVMRYGPREVPVRSRQQLYATDELGRAFVVQRDAAAEQRVLTALIDQHPDFAAQLVQPSDALYLPRTQFLQPDWFLAAFEQWRDAGICILGFNELRQNRLNAYRAEVSVQVHCGENNWFDTELLVRFGPQQAKLRHLQKAVRQRSRYVPLDDGTQGLLPEEWVARFAAYFAAGEVVDERLRTPSVGFSNLLELYDPAALTRAARARVAQYQAAAADFTGIAPVAAPAALRATLREYQLLGLRWLSFLSTFGFGGILADDMGLGKTLQVLALLLHRREKGHRGASLVVVPTSLLFNWQAEAAKFAPTLRVRTLHGSSRPGTSAFEEADIVLTTYHTVLADIRWLREYRFDYVVLDEAQAVKNPDSQRYKAVSLLQSRHRLVLTGTPVENRTTDLYALLSFACPGLLGSRQHFRDQYALPIDKFKDLKRARTLQQKISPFVLRRTKSQVAAELPAKTEMVLYCELDAEQRRLYEACRQDVRARLMGQLEELPGKQGLHLLRGLTRLRQLCNAPALLPDEADYGRSSAKLQVLLEELETRAPQHKILVFSQFVGMLDLIRPELEARGIGYRVLTGQTRRRAEAVQAFQEDESVRVFLVSLKAGGVGLNLTAADYVYLVDPWWNPAVENQAIDRSHRLGQTRPVVAVRLICPDTVEEKMMALQQGKRELAYELVKTDAALLKTFSREDLLTLLS